MRPGGAQDGYDTYYGYDKNNNRTATYRVQDGQAGVTSNYSVDDNDKFLSGEGYTFGNYDGNGNPGTITRPA